MTSNDVEDQSASSMTQMAIVVDRHSAHVHAHSFRRQRLKRFFLAGQRVVDRQHRLPMTPVSAGALANATTQSSRWPRRARRRSQYRIGGSSLSAAPNALPFSRRHRPEDNTRATNRERQRV